MNEPREAPFGTWASSVSPEVLATAAIQLGELAARAKPKLLIATHNGRRAPATQLLTDIRRSFTGNVVIAEDLQRF